MDLIRYEETSVQGTLSAGPTKSSQSVPNQRTIGVASSQNQVLEFAVVIVWISYGYAVDILEQAVRDQGKRSQLNLDRRIGLERTRNAR